MSEATILPDNATGLERSVDLTAAGRLAALDAEAPARFRRPNTTPVAHLAFLGYEVDAPLWRGLIEPERRAIIAASPDLHRQAGTLAGIRRLTGWLGGEVRRVTTRRQRAFAGPTLTEAEREAWLLRLPELRMYLFRRRAHAAPGALWVGRIAAGRRFMVASTAPVRYGERATLVRGGVETDLTVWTTEPGPERITTLLRRIALPGTAPRGYWRFPGRSLRASTAGQRLYTLTEVLLDRGPSTLMRRILPGPIDLRPVAIGFEAVALAGSGNSLRHSGAILRGQSLVPSVARDRMFLRARLADPSVPPAQRSRGAYLRRSRLAPPAARAEIVMAFPQARPRRAIGRFCRGFAAAGSTAGLDRIKSALEWGRPLGMAWRLDTRTMVPILAGYAMAGAVMAGQQIGV